MTFDYLYLNNSMIERINTRFTKIKKIGEGSYGTVNQVYDNHLQCYRALKKIKFVEDDEGVPVNAIR